MQSLDTLVRPLSRRTLLRTAACAAALVATGHESAAAEPLPAAFQPAPPVSRFKVGDFTVTKVMDLDGVRIPAPAGVPKEYYTQNLDWLVPQHYDPRAHYLVLSIQAYVIQGPKLLLIIDPGLGDNKPRPISGAHSEFNRQGGPWLHNFKSAGFRREDVTAVVSTHLHGDHIGYNTALEGGRWVPTFPKARYYFSKIDVEDIAKPNATGGYSRDFVESIQPVIDNGLGQLVEGEVTIAEGVKLVPIPGHTPGHYSVHLMSKGKHAIFTGDLWHSALEVMYPRIPALDRDPIPAQEAREKFFETYADKDVLIVPAHHTHPSAGYIVTVPGRGRIFRSADLE